MAEEIRYTRSRSRLTRISEIQNRVRQSYDRAYYDGIYKRQLFQLGQEWTSGIDKQELWDAVPTYDDVRISSLRVGESMRILNTGYITMSRTMGKDPDPSFPHNDRTTAEIKRQFFLRADDRPGVDEGEWADVYPFAFSEGDQFGVGCVQIGLTKQKGTGRRAVTLQHVPLLQCLWDRFARNPAASRWAAVVHYMAPEDVKRLYGGKALDGNVRQWNDGFDDQIYDVVRVIEYWDTGFGGGEPTYAVFVGNLTGVGNKPVVHVRNVFEIIPLAFMTNYIVPGMKRPIGRVHMQQASQELINQIERRMIDIVSRGGSIDLIDEEAIDPSDWQLMLNGDKTARLRVTKQLQQNPWTRIPAQEIEEGMLTLYSLMERQYQADSGLSEMDRGALSGVRRSATEIATMDTRLSLNQAWPQRQAAKFLRRVIERVLHVASVADEVPVDVYVNGALITLNLPGEPMSDVSNWLSQPSPVLISPESLTGEEDQQKMQRRLAFLTNMAGLGLVGSTIDPVWFTEEYLKAGGKDEAKIAMAHLGVGGVQQAVPPAMMQAGTTGKSTTQPVGLGSGLNVA